MRNLLPAVPVFSYVPVLVVLAIAPGCSRVFEPTPTLSAEQGRIRTLLDEGRYDAAQAAAESLSRPGQRGDSTSFEIDALTMDLLLEARWRNGDASGDTLSTAERVVATRRQSGDQRQLAYGLRGLGRIHLLAGNPVEAVRALDESLRLFEQARPRDDRAIADALDQLAAGLVETAKYDDAARLLRRAGRLRDAARPRDEVPVARTLELTALAALRAGRYPDARVSLDRALAIRDRLPLSAEAAAVFSLDGDLLWLEGRPALARDAAARCVKVAATTLRPAHPDLARCMRQLGNMLASFGDLTGALERLEAATEIARKSLGPEHPLFSAYLNDLAEVHRTRKDYQKARALYEQALTIREQRLGPNHQALAGIVYNLGLVSAELGDVAEAERQFNRAARIWRLQLRPDHPFVALAMSSLAHALMQHGSAGEALSLHKQVLAIRERSLGPQHRDTGDAFADVAAALVALGRVKEAAVASARAMDIWGRTGNTDSPGYAAALTQRGNVLAATGDVRAAQQSYASALAITERVLGPEHPNTADLRVRLGWVALTGGEVNHAFEEALAAERASRIFLQSTVRYLTEREALAYGAARPNGLNLVLSIATRPDAASAHGASALDAVIKTRALVLDEIAARKNTVRERREPGLDALWSAWASARQRLANLVVREDAARSEASYQAASEIARRDAERAERALAEKSASFKAQREKPEAGLAEIRAALPADSALVSFVRHTGASDVRSGIAGAKGAVDSYVAFVVTAALPEPAVIPLGAAASIERELLSWRRGLTMTAGVGTQAEREQRLRIVGERLKRLIWDPLDPFIRSTNRVFIVPDGALHLVNLAALPVGASDYLLDRGPTIHYLTAERDLVQFAAAASPPAGATSLLAIGGASFDTSQSPSDRPQTRAAKTTVGSQCGSFESLQFNPLPETLGEVRDVTQLWNRQDAKAQVKRTADLLTGLAASERAFKTQAPGRRVLHLATHGFFLGGDCGTGSDGRRSVGGVVTARNAQANIQNSPLLQAGLALAGANQRAQAKADEEDGILTAEEVAALNLEGVEWAVLSACDTGLGQIKAGEGVFGLRRAFQIAGARTVIMSLWSVEDKATSEWMLALYEARLTQRRSTADAVREASASMLRDRRAKGLSTHPFYWAAFVAAGDWH